jgi:hypothetical protein
MGVIKYFNCLILRLGIIINNGFGHIFGVYNILIINIQRTFYIYF